MPLKLNVGVSKKVGLPDYSSAGATCNLELELDAHLLDGDLDAFHRRVRSAYVACQRSVLDELERLQAPPINLTPSTGRPNGSPRSNRSPVLHSPVERTQPPKYATPGQIRALAAIARSHHADLAGLLQDYDVDRPEALTVKQASELIDRLKAAAEV